MKFIKIDFANKWNYLLVVSFIVSNLMIFLIDIKIDRQKNIFWSLYLLVFFFLPIIFGFFLSKFLKRYFLIDSDKIKNLRQELYNSIGTDKYPINLIRETIEEKRNERYFQFEGIFNRTLVLYYLGIIGCLVLIVTV